MPSRASQVYARMIGSYMPYALLVLLLVGLDRGSLWLVGPLVLLYLVVPSLDAMFAKDRVSLNRSDFESWQIATCRLAPHGFVSGYIALLLLYLTRVTSLSATEFALALASMGAVGSIAITASHELIHKRSRVARLVARAGLLVVLDMPFEITHLRCHHKHAATSLDHHTGWYNEGFLTYLVRTTKGWIRFVSDFERARLERLGLSFYSVRNVLFVFYGLPVILMFSILWFLGVLALVFFVAQAFIAVISLEAVSYIEHYGLMRDVKDGYPGRMDNRHSWDAYHRFSGYLTFLLQRHADHHDDPTKDFFLLRANEESPELPVGYPLLVLLVTFSNPWFKLIHPLFRKR